ncbi:hypothetical protein [Paenibacillus crassostreae]|nr:hypothetical protein [Paenibacillus crassostreae]
MTSALHLVLKFGFLSLGLHRIQAAILPTINLHVAY